MSLRRFCAAPLFVLTLTTVGCGLHDAESANKRAGSAEWVSAKNVDLRSVTAIVRVAPPARLKATLEAAAARSDDADYADFLRRHAGGGFGSGFLMVHRNADGEPAAFVVTNRHVIADSDEAEISFADGTTYKNCAVTYASPKYDLAVLALPESAARARGAGLRPAAQDASDRLAVVAAGYPGVGGRPSYQITDGKVSNAKFSMPEVSGGLPGAPTEVLIQHTAPIDPGSSGGPLTDESGRVVGVNVMLVRSRASMFFAVPSSAVVETVRYAHALSAKKQSAQWMTSELEGACTKLAAELASSERSVPKLDAFVSTTFVAERGIESYMFVSHIPQLAQDIQRTFYQDPMTAMHASLLVRLSHRTYVEGGATGACQRVHPGDAATITEGGNRPIRLGVMTKSGNPIELAWIFEHGQWRIAGANIDVPATPTGAAAGAAAADADAEDERTARPRTTTSSSTKAPSASQRRSVANTSKGGKR